MPSLDYRTVSEDRIKPGQREVIRALLADSFPGFFEDRIYHKQIPHWRVLVWSGPRLVAQICVDHRAIQVGGKPLRVFGIVDLCVAPEKRASGVASELIKRVHRRARRSGIPYVILFADDQRLYRRHGYERVESTVTYLAIDDHKTLDVRRESFADCLMVATMRKTQAGWPEGPVDLLGYVF